MKKKIISALAITTAIACSFSPVAVYALAEDEPVTVNEETKESISTEETDSRKQNEEGTYEESNASDAVLLKVGDKELKYDSPSKAWNAANSEYVGQKVEIVLLDDWMGDKDGNLGTGAGFEDGRLFPVTRDLSNELVINLNGYKIDRNLPVIGCRENGGILKYCNDGNIIIKNGKLTGGRNTGCGGCIYAVGANGHRGYLNLENVEITDNQSLDEGGGIYVSGRDTGLTIRGDKNSLTGNGTYIHGNYAKYDGGGVLVTGDVLHLIPLRLSGIVNIKENNSGNKGKNLSFTDRAMICHPHLADGSEIYVFANVFWAPVRITEFAGGKDNLDRQLNYIKADESKHRVVVKKKPFRKDWALYISNN